MKDAAGDATDRIFEVQQTEACVFLPSPTPRKLTNKKAQPDWDDAGSLAICSSNTKDAWNLKGDGMHSKGLVTLGQRWVLMDGEQGLSCNPEKPGIYLTGPIKVEAGHLVCLT